MKVLYIFFVVAFALCATVSADKDGRCGSNLVWSLADGVITISGRGEMTNYAEGNEAPWHDICYSMVESVVIEEGVKTIGNRAFYKCEYLKSVTMPRSLRTIGTEAFSYTGFSDVVIPEGVTGIRDRAFSYSSLSSVTIPPTVSVIGAEAFYSSGLGSVTIPRSVTTIGESAFAFCYSLNYIDVEEGNQKFRSVDGVLFTYHMSVLVQYPIAKAASVYSISNRVKTIASNAFAHAIKLNYVNIPEGVRKIGDGAFQSCWGLSSVDIPDTVTVIGKLAFYYDYYIKKIRFGNNVTTIGEQAFYLCSGIKDIVLGSNVVTIEKEAFLSCNELTSITLPNSLTTIGSNVFGGCSMLKNINLEEDNNNFVFENGALIDVNKQTLVLYIPRDGVSSYIIPDSVTAIEGCAFRSVSELTTITIGQNVETIGESAFENCDKIQTITIPDKVKTIGNSAFKGCTELTTVSLNKVESIGDEAFSGCGKLKTVTIPSSVKTIGQEAFAYCSGDAFKNVNIPENVIFLGKKAFYGCGATKVTIGDGLTSIANEAFASCSKLTEVSFGNNVKSIEDNAFSDDSVLTSITIPASVTSIGYNVFSGCTSLTSIKVAAGSEDFSETGGVLFDKSKTTLVVFPLGKKDTTSYSVPNSVRKIRKAAFAQNKNLLQVTFSSVETIEDEAFCDCSLTTVNMGNNVKTIGNSAFSGCGDLANLVLSNKLVSIGESAFEFDTSLTTVTIPNSVTRLGSRAFRYCTKLNQLTLGTGLETIGDSAFDGDDLNGLIIPNNVKEIGDYAFRCQYYGDYSIPSLDLGTVRTIGSGAFSSCAMTEVTIPSTVEYIANDAFKYCSGLERFKVKAGNAHYSSSDNGVLFNNDKSVLVKFPRANSMQSYTVPTSVTTIAGIAFEECGNLKTVTIGENVKTIGDGAFTSCQALATVNFGGKVQRIGKFAFAGCYYLTTVDLPESVRTIGDHAFSSCGITSLTLRNGLESIDSHAFEYCSSLTSVEFPESLKTIGREAFRNCGLKEVTIGGSVTVIEYETFEQDYQLQRVTILDNVKTIKGEAFNSCPKLSQVIIGSGVSTIADSAFFCPYSCNSYELQSIVVDERNNFYSSEDGVLFDHDKTILMKYPVAKDANTYTVPNSVVTIMDDAFKQSKLNHVEIGENVKTIGSYAFESCTNLGNVHFPDTLETIGDHAFYYCGKITEVTLPDNVYVIGESAFGYCENLKDITIGESMVSIGQYAFSGNSKLAKIEYQSPTVIDAFNLFYDDEVIQSITVCVPPYYNSQQFGDGHVTPKKCSNFMDQFDQCHKAVPDGKGKYMPKWKHNATKWTERTNDCVKYECHDTLGYLLFNMCNSTDTEHLICVNQKCVDADSYTPPTYVDAEMEDGVSVNEMDEESFIALLGEYGADTNGLSFGYEGEATGNAGHMYFYAPNELTAKNAGETALVMKDEEEGVFSKIKRVRIVSWQNLDSGAMLSVKTATTLLLFVVMLLILF